MTDCTFSATDSPPREDGKREYTCIRCGNPRWSKYGPELQHRECGVAGLGDHVATVLAAIGVTSARVAWFLRAARIIEADAGCGCDERKARLNRVGERLLAWARRLK